jgi:hypothetical protein
MSFITGAQSERLYQMSSPGAALATSTTKSLISANSSTNAPYQMPPLLNVWPPDKIVGRGLRSVARGGVGTTGTPTLLVGCYLDPTQNSVTSQIVLAATGAFTTASALGGGASMTANWELEFEMHITAVGVTSGAYNITVQTNGVFTIGPGNDAATATSVAYMVGSNTSKTTIVPTTQYFPEIWAQWGTSNAANSIQCNQFAVDALN